MCNKLIQSSGSRQRAARLWRVPNACGRPSYDGRRCTVGDARCIHCAFGTVITTARATGRCSACTRQWHVCMSRCAHSRSELHGEQEFNTDISTMHAIRHVAGIVSAMSLARPRLKPCITGQCLPGFLPEERRRHAHHACIQCPLLGPKVSCFCMYLPAKDTTNRIGADE